MSPTDATSARRPGHQRLLPNTRSMGLYENAIAKFTGIIEIAPDWEAGIAYKGRSIAYAAAGEYRLALADSSEVVRRYPGAASHYERGLVYLMVEDYHHAAEDFRKALEFEDHPGARRGLALIHIAQDDLIAALCEIDKAIAISLNTGRLHSRRAKTSTDLGNIDEALAELAAFHFMIR
jgi:tetratricopeptide (TPR) repeat protein